MRNPCRTVAVGLGLLTLLLLPGITGLGTKCFQEQIEARYKLEIENYNLTQRISQSEKEVAQLQERLEDSHEQATAAEEEVARLQANNSNLQAVNSNLQAVNSNLQAVNSNLQAVNSNITAQRDELQKRLDRRTRCPQYWQKFGNHCYYVSTSTKTWEESKKDCESRDAYLVIIRSAEEQEFIRGLGVRAWIGLVRQEDRVNWKWVDGSPLTTTAYWKVGEPNNYENVHEDCVEILGHLGGDYFLWNDNVCGYLDKWICEMEI